MTIVHRSGDTHVHSLETRNAFVLEGGSITTEQIIYHHTFTLAGPTFGFQERPEIRDANLFAGPSPDAQLIANDGRSTLGNVTLHDGILIEAGVNTNFTHVHVRNGLTLHGELIQRTTGSGASNLRFEGTQTFDGAGTAIFDQLGNKSIVPETQGTLLTIGPEITIINRSAAGNVTIGDTSAGHGVVNRGTIIHEPTGPSSMRLEGGPDLGFTNEGAAITHDTDTLLRLRNARDTAGITVVGPARLLIDSAFYTTATIELTDASLTLAAPMTTTDAANWINRTGGRLVLTSQGLLDNRDQTLDLAATLGTLELEHNGRIEGGTIVGTDGAEVVASFGTSHLDGVTLDAPLRIEPNATVRLHNGLTLHDEIRLEGLNLSQRSRLQLAGSQTITGSGAIIFDGGPGSAGNLIHGLDTSTDALTIDEGITIRTGAGGGLINLGAGGVNRGTIISSVDEREISMSAPGPWTNEGVVQISDGGSFRATNLTDAAGLSISGGGTLTLDSNWTNTGTISATDSQLELRGNWSNTGVINAVDSNVQIGSGNQRFTLSDLSGFHRTGGEVRLGGRLDLEGGTLELNEDTGTWLFAGRIENGTIAATDGAELLPQPGTSHLDNVTLATGLRRDHATVEVHNGLTLHGELLFENTTTSNIHLWFRGDQTLEGTGTIVFGGETVGFGGAPIAGRQGVAPLQGVLTIGPDITIRTGTGSGHVGTGGGGRDVINHGTLLAQNENTMLQVRAGDDDGFVNHGHIAAGNDAILEFAFGPWRNEGVIDADDAEIRLGGTFTTAGLGTFDRTDNTDVRLTGTLDNEQTVLDIETAIGAFVVDGGTIRGGTVTSSGDTPLVLDVTSRLEHLTLAPELTVTLGDPGFLQGIGFENVTLGTDLELTNGHILAVLDRLTLENEAELRLASTGSITELRFSSDEQDASIEGDGMVVLTGHPTANRISVWGHDTTLTIAPGVTIRTDGGGGQFLGISAHSNQHIINRGRIISQGNDHTLDIGASLSSFTNEGTLEVRHGGTIRLRSSFGANTGTLNAGAGGRFTLDGGLANADTGRVEIDLAGAEPADLGRIDVAGQATLAGLLLLDWIDAFEPDEGESLQLMSFGSRAGEFDELVSVGLDEQIELELLYTDTDLHVRRAQVGPDALSTSTTLETLHAGSAPSAVRWLEAEAASADSDHAMFDDRVDALAALTGTNDQPVAPTIAARSLRPPALMTATLWDRRLNSRPFGLAMNEARLHVWPISSTLGERDPHRDERWHWPGIDGAPVQIL